MHIYLLRHGIAENAAAGESDADRKLTEAGREKLSELLHRVHKASIRPDTILTSPYKRARETAELAAEILHGPKPVTSEALTPNGTPRGLWNEVRANPDATDLLMAGHEPLFSQSISYLLNAPTLKVDMKKGAMVAIEFDSLRGEPRGVLRWMLIHKLCS